MSTQLSKLHVRFIQSQKNFSLRKDTDQDFQKLPLSHLYIKDNTHFYLITDKQTYTDKETIHISFSESTNALEKLTCTLSLQEVPQGSEEYEDALLFFSTDTSKVKQLFLAHITEIEDMLFMAAGFDGSWLK